MLRSLILWDHKSCPSCKFNPSSALSRMVQPSLSLLLFSWKKEPIHLINIYFEQLRYVRADVGMKLGVLNQNGWKHRVKLSNLLISDDSEGWDYQVTTSWLMQSTFFLKHGIVTQTATLNCDNHLNNKSMHIIFQKILLLSQQWSQLLDEQQRTQPKKKKKQGRIWLKWFSLSKDKYSLLV